MRPMGYQHGKAVFMEYTFYCLCDMKTTYKIMHCIELIHILRRWCQELLAYNISCIHRNHLMMADVNYLSRIHNELRKHMYPLQTDCH